MDDPLLRLLGSGRFWLIAVGGLFVLGVIVRWLHMAGALGP